MDQVSTLSCLGLVQLPIIIIVDNDTYIGEFGIVHRAHLMKNSLQSVTTIPVAVKMMKGIVIVPLVYRNCTCLSHLFF